MASAERSRPKARTGGGRLTRTVLLAAGALAAGLYWLSREGWIDGSEVGSYALISLLFVALPLLAGALVAVLLAIFRRRRAALPNRSVDTARPDS